MMMCSLQLGRRWSVGANVKEMLWRWAGIGLIVGLGLWAHPIFCIGIVTAGTWLAAVCLMYSIRQSRRGVSRQEIQQTVFRGLWTAVAAIPACLIGLLPVLYWGATHNWDNVTFLFSASSQSSMDRFTMTGRLLDLYNNCVSKRVAGGAVPLEIVLMTRIHRYTYALVQMSIGLTIVLVAISFFYKRNWVEQCRKLVVLPLILGGSALLLFTSSSFSLSGLTVSCEHDFTGRYALPISLALPFVFATAFVFLSLVIQEGVRYLGNRGVGLKKQNVSLFIG